MLVSRLTIDETDLLRAAATLIDEKKGEETVIIDLQEESIPTSYFLITEADNPAHVKAIISNLSENLPAKLLHREGLRERRWVILDYGQIVIHVLSKEARAFYDIESLWKDRIIDKDNLLARKEALA